MSGASAGATIDAKVEHQHRLDWGTTFASAALASLLMGLAIVLAGAAKAHAEDRVEPYRADREAYINGFRVSGKHDPAPLALLQHDLRSLSDATSGETQARALLELGSVQRLSNEFPEAVSTLTKSAELATRLGRSDVAFDAWIEIARAHIVGTHDHGAAQAAIDRAVAAAGSKASPKQRYEIARYDAEGSVARGELEAGLVGALDAVRLAPGPDDRFYGELDAGDAIEKMAWSCDYRPLWDQHSQDDPPNDPWGACRRAVAAARAAYDRAARTAHELGWKWLAGSARQFAQLLDDRLQVIELRAQWTASRTAVFEPRDKKDVLVESADFAHRSVLAARKNVAAEHPELARGEEQALDEAQKAPGGKDNPSSLYLRGDLEEMQGGNPEQAAEFYVRAVSLLADQRSSYFDPRRRGTVIESNGGVFYDLALRLLALNRDADAFAFLEAARARGLGEMEQALAQKDVTAANRTDLADLLRLEAETSAAETSIVERAIGEGRLDIPRDDLLRWEKSESARRSYLLSHGAIRDRFARTRFLPASLGDLQQAASRSGIPVLLYWVANSYVTVWYVGPHGSDVRIVFLPEAVLTRKIAQLVGTIDRRGKIFDERAARELYLYLIAPFEDLLDAKEVVIVPQGPIVGLPFEALLESATGGFLVDRWVVSYAPNATMAYQALNRPVPKITQVTAIIDPALDYTEEKKGIQSVPGLQLSAFDSTDVLPDKLGDTVRGAESVHMLVHGRFDITEPLLSVLGDNLPATALVALPLEGMKLVVLSACESGVLEVRISNEIYGFPWVLLAGGVENVVTSRWVVDGASNGAWMRSFYAALASGSSPAAAAAAAMRAMHKEGENNPYYWAAMQVNGR